MAGLVERPGGIAAGRLVEREAELAQIGRLIEAAKGGSGGFVLVEGQAGIGKTRLLAEAGRLASAEGMEVLSARGVELERQFAFGVVRQLFEGQLAARSSRQRRELLSGAASLAGSLLGFPTLGGPAPPVADNSFATEYGLYWLCFNLASRAPLLLSLDDAHWADEASLRWASFLVARLAGLPVLLALALRPGERAAADDVLGAIRNDPGAHLLRPAPLSERACEGLIREAFTVAPAGAFCRACFTATGGNPFYMRALVEGLRSDDVSPDTAGAELVGTQVPDTAVRSLMLRLSRLPATAPALARALAVLGTDVELRDAAALAELELEQAAEAADLLTSAAVLAPGRPVSFAHPIVEGAIYADLSPGQRSRLHARAARILAGSDATPERIASHVLASEPSGDSWSVGVLRAAAADALARGAPDSALTYLQRAQREGPTGDVVGPLRRELGFAEFLMHQPAAIEHLAEALSITTEPRERASIAQVLSTALLFADRCHDAVGILDRAVNELDAVDPVLAQALEAQLIGVSAQQLSTREVHARHFERVRARALGDSPAERQLLAHLAHWTGIAGDAPASVLRTLAERAAAEGELLAEVTSDSQTFYCVPCCLYYSDSLEPARYWLDRALDDARARGSLVGFATASCLRSDVLYRLGELAEAEADARAAIEAAGSEGWVLAPAAVDFLTQVLIERGELTEAEALVAGSQIPTGLDEPVITNWLLHARALLQLANGELQSATDNLLRCGEWFNAWGARNPGVIDWRTDATLALAQLGELDHARRLSAEAIGLSKTMEEPRSLGMALRAAGIIEGGADGVDLLREAVTTLASSPARLEHARALVDLGAALRRQNHRKEAREPLRQGTALAGRSGATVLAGRGQSELIATGARPRRLSLSGIEALTPQERRVAGLAADGLSSPQIAQQLFVTVNTVESHLRHAYAKLDIHSRNELPRALATS